MDKFSFGEIVLLRFPLTDGKTYKKRPALIINDFVDGDILVTRITSQIYKTKYDIYFSIGIKLD
jgi:mRNA interferase MazF